MTAEAASTPRTEDKVQVLKDKLIESLRTTPADCDGREPLWCELHALLRAADQSDAVAQSSTSGGA